VNEQRTPAGRSRAKSYTQLRGSAQRPVPFSAQSIVNGSTSRGSPKGTIGFAKRAVTWRTPFTSPRGLKNSTGGADGWAAAWAANASVASAARTDSRCMESPEAQQWLRIGTRRGGKQVSIRGATADRLWQTAGMPCARKSK
jgi:hypothetical protein